MRWTGPCFGSASYIDGCKLHTVLDVDTRFCPGGPTSFVQGDQNCTFCALSSGIRLRSYYVVHSNIDTPSPPSLISRFLLYHTHLSNIRCTMLRHSSIILQSFRPRIHMMQQQHHIFPAVSPFISLHYSTKSSIPGEANCVVIWWRYYRHVCGLPSRKVRCQRCVATGTR